MSDKEINTRLRNFLSKNRAQELGEDVWEHYIIPPFYESLDFFNSTKPRVIVGGRGCGKTMTLRYFSHNTMFSSKRGNVPLETLNHIGLYKRFDTQFCMMMQGRGLEKQDWIIAFTHYFTLLFIDEILNSLSSINKCDFDKVVNKSSISEINLTSLQSFNNEIPSSVKEFRSFVRKETWKFESWISNLDDEDKPKFLPHEIISHLISLIKESFTDLSNSTFYIYIDEFENLRDYQQEVINTRVKHSESDLIYNFAMKQNPKFNKKTLGEENIIDPADYKTINLDSLLRGKDSGSFSVFAGEILLSELQNNKLGNFGVDVSLLKKIDSIDARSSKEYKAGIMQKVGNIFPKISTEELAEEIFKDKNLKQELYQDIQSYIEGDFDVNYFDSAPKKSVIILPALFSRKDAKHDSILKEFDKLKRNELSKFDGWIHNNFLACFLKIYSLSQKKYCPLYSGFETFCLLSNTNLRSLLVLCENSIKHANVDRTLDDVSISYNDQAKGARDASYIMLNEVKSFGRSGLKLNQFVNRLGYIFHKDHMKIEQSENERNHFAITSEKEGKLSDYSHDLLMEAEKWSVLYTRKGTKKKTKNSPEIDEYILNPIFSPYFMISYRKKKRLELSANDINVLFEGSLEEYKKLIAKYGKSSKKAKSENSVEPNFLSVLEG